VRAWLTAANFTGALTVFLYLTLAAPDGGGVDDPNAEQVTVAFVVYMVISIVVGGPLAHRLVAPARQWVEAERPATPEEQRAALDLPWRVAVLGFSFWLGAAVLFGGLSAWHGDPGRQVARVVSGVVLGGSAASTVCYLMLDRVLRPVFAAILAGGSPPSSRSVGIRKRIVLSWALGSGVPLLAIAASPAGERTGSGVADLAVLAGIGFVAGGLMVAIATRSVSDRLEAVRDGLRNVEGGDIDVEVAVDEGGEVGQLQAGSNRMVRGLRERREIEDLFGRHVGEDVARQALQRGVALGGEQREASVLFVDMVGSTTAAAELPPSEVVTMLNDLFAAVARAVDGEGGWINKFEGDGAMCVFGTPVDQPDHAARALRAARRIRDGAAALARRHPRLDVGIGVSSGTVVAGNVGAEQRYEYTLIGDPVNEAARLTEAAKLRPGRVLASRRTASAAGAEGAAWLPGPSLELRGRPAPTETSEAPGETPPSDPLASDPDVSAARELRA
jgi:adenylate cyclase